MRISPIFTNCKSLSAKGSAPSKMQCRKPARFDNSTNKGDIFIRLAEASIKDKKIECELQSMGLI